MSERKSDVYQSRVKDSDRVASQATAQKTKTHEESDSEFDPFGVAKIYHTKSGGQEWFMRYDSIQDLKNDERVQNWQHEGDVKRLDNDIWEASGGDNGQFRFEVWSPKMPSKEQTLNARWHNVEITAYCKVISKHGDPPYAWQLYSRGGHHSKTRPCEGSALKGRWWNSDGANSVVKEICHSAYTNNTAKTTGHVPDSYGNNRWYGSKLVIYNIEENCHTYTKQEVYTDHDVNDSNGNLVVRNNWHLVTSHVDRGGWFANKSCFDTDCRNCDRARDLILTSPGGDLRETLENGHRNPNYSRNLVALRSDQETIWFTFLSAREIDPTKPIAAKDYVREGEEEGDDENDEVDEPGLI